MQVSIEYHIITTSDWTKFQIVEGGSWSDWQVNCLKGCNKLRQGIEVNDKTITIAKAPRDTTLVEARMRCTLHIDKKYLDSDISYLITKGDLESTTVKIVVQGKEITPEKTNLYNIKGNPDNPMAFKVSTSRHVSAYEKAKIVQAIGITPKEYGELENRAKRFLKFERTRNIIKGSQILIIIFPYILYILVTAVYMGRQQSEPWEFPVLAVVGGVIAGMSHRVLSRKMRKYKLEDDEWAEYYTYSIVDNLESYFKAKTTGLKRDHRKKTAKLAKDFLSCIKQRWKIGAFKLAQDYFGKSLSELQRNLEYRVIPTLKEKGDDKSLKNVEQIMINFLAETRSLDLESINRINEQMSSRLDKIEHVGFRSRLSNFFSAHRILKHGLFISTAAIGCCVFYFVILNYVGISKDYVFVATITLLAAFLTIYFTKQPKEQPS